mgnify:CR=1 FL=1
MAPISRERLKEMMDEGDDFKLVEVLSEDEFAEYHRPDAVNIPLDEDFTRNFSNIIPDKETKVVLYCKDDECRASENAARKIEQMGYQFVLEYPGGKEDWREHGLPLVS